MLKTKFVIPTFKLFSKSTAFSCYLSALQSPKWFLVTYWLRLILGQVEIFDKNYKKLLILASMKLTAAENDQPWITFPWRTDTWTNEHFFESSWHKGRRPPYSIRRRWNPTFWDSPTFSMVRGHAKNCAFRYDSIYLQVRFKIGPIQPLNFFFLKCFVLWTLIKINKGVS